MLKNGWKILIVLLLLPSLIPRDAKASEKTKTIVIFFSLHAGLPAYQNFLEGFRTTFSEEPDENYNLLIEYLDIGRLSDDKYAKYIVDLYNEKYKNVDIDLLITVSPGVNQVLIKYGFEALKKSKIISIEFDALASDQGLLPSENVTKVIMKLRFTETIQKACNLFPSCKNIFVISGCAPTDKYFASIVKAGSGGLEKQYNLTFISDLSLDSTLKFVSKIPENSVVIVPTFLSDKNGIQFSTPEIIGLFSTNCSSPIFPVFDSFIKREGGVGGFVFSFNSLGKETSRIAKEILKGIPMKEIAFNYAGLYQNIFDWRVLKKWGLIKSQALPSDSIYYYRESDFISEYKWYILAGLLFLVLETFLIVYLYKLNVRQKEIVRQKIEAENLYRIIVREERLMMMVELTASLSHELSQPLTAILYNAQACVRFLKMEKPDPVQIEEILLKIIKDDKRAGSLISSVRSLMKLEMRDKELVNLNSVIQDSLVIFKSEALNKNIKIINHPQDRIVNVFGDKIQLEQVLLNFLYNAGHAIENCDIDKRIIEIFQHINKDSVRVSVRDSGKGIEVEIKEKLFKPFVTTRESGFGIGLAVSRSIIENHNGEIWAENIPDGGAEFSFRLKILKDEASR
ncbi:MAG: sensor histidine kinase [Bacteroidales bacterium]